LHDDYKFILAYCRLFDHINVVMHELSIAQSIVDLASEKVKEAEAGRVISITLSLGLLSGVVRESLEFCFPIACEKTPCEGAVLKIDIVPAKAHCSSCGGDFDMEEFVLVCPGCGFFPVELLAGGELKVISLEVE